MLLAVSLSFSTNLHAAALLFTFNIFVDSTTMGGFEIVTIVRNIENSLTRLNLTFIHELNDETGSDVSAAPLGIINCIFRAFALTQSTKTNTRSVVASSLNL